MVTLIIVKNPFSPQDGREVKHIEAQGTLADLLKENAVENVELQATINGYSVDEKTEIKDEDFIVIYPVVGKGDKGGKGILGIVAAIALSVVSFGIASSGWLAGLGTAFKAGMWGAYAAAAAVMFLGSSLMGRFMGQNADLGSYDSENSKATYSWGDVQTMEGQNNAIALNYGMVKSGGQTIGKYVKIDDNEEYLNWLVAAGEGEVTFSEIKLNDNDYGNYDDVEVTTRSGTNDQDIISEFGDTYATKNLNYKLDSSWSKDSAQGGDTRGLIFTVEFPNGLCHITDSGKLENAWVRLDIEYRVSGGTWTNFFKEIDSVTSSQFSTVASTGITLKSNVSVGNYKFSITPVFRVSAQDSGSGDADVFDGVTVKIGDSTGRIPLSSFNNKKTVNVGSYSVNTAKWSDAVRNRLKNGNACTGTLTVLTGNGVGTITSNSRSAVRKQFRVNSLPAGEYEVRARVSARQYSENDSQASSTCYWTAITSIIYDNFIYPCTALIGIKAKATDQLSGSPSLSFLKRRAKVWVWNSTAGEYQEKPANNPAWACYDLLHQARKLRNVNTNKDVFEVRGVPADRMRFADFNTWASWCNTMKLYVNIEINTTGEVLDVANQKIAPIGRGMVVRFGTKYGCIFDRTQQPKQMFNMGNIITGTFQEEFLKISDRANCVEVTYTNASADYQRDVLTIYGDTYNTDGYAKTAQLTLDGITSYEQAFREGKYQLACNKYQLRTVSFEADIDSIACTVGDVVLVAHDVPKWANSGRVESVEDNTILLPCYVEDTTKSYRIQYRKQNDNLYTKPCTIVSSTEDGWTTITVDDTSNMPEAGDVFDLAIASIGSKPFVIKSITRSQQFRRKLTCIEYAEALYNEDYDIPVIEYSTAEQEKAPKNVTRLSATQYAYTDSARLKRNVMSVSWQRPSNGGKFTVLYSTDKKTWLTGITETDSDSVEFEVPRGSYYVKVITTLGLRQSSGVTTSSKIPAGVDELPPDVTRFIVERMASGTRRFWWEFEYPTPNDIAGFRLKYTQSATPNWDKGIPVQDGLVTSQPYETEMVRQGVHAVMIKAVDNAGQESKNFAYTVLDLGDLIEENVLWTKDFAENTWADAEYDGVILYDGSIGSKDSSLMWESPQEYRWSAGTDDMWTPTFETLNAEFVFTPPASGQFWVKSDIDGPGIVYYSNKKLPYRYRWTWKNKSRWKSPTGAEWSTVNNAWEMDRQWSDRVLVDAGEPIRVKVVGLNDGNKRTQIKALSVVVDVPDEMEHFNDLYVPTTGLEIPVSIPNYYTTSVRIDAIQNTTQTNPVMVQIVSKTPCVIKLLNASGVVVDGTVDVTWQGFRKEII